MFDKYIKNNFKYDIHVNTSYEDNYKNIGDEIVVSGSPGNDIFYKPIGTIDQPPLNRYDAWMVFRDPSRGVYHYADSPYEQVLADCNLEFLQDFIKKSPRKIETLQDLRWWVCFCFNWYTTLNNSSIGVGLDTAKKLHHFYNTDDFQLWSIYNKDPITKVGDYSDDRWQLREMIYEYTRDNHYSTKKNDFISVLSKFDPNWLFLLNDYSNVCIKMV
jgi:hypothetical protein